MNTFKKNGFRIAAAAALFTVSLGATAFAEGYGKEDGKDFVDKKIARMTKDLDLTDEQVAKIRPILERKGEEMKALMQRTHEEIGAVLTPEQKEKLEAKKEEWKKKREERKKDKHGHDDGE